MDTAPLPLATVMDLLLDAVCVVDGEGRYLFVSAGFERILGYRADEVLGRPMIELVHPDDRERTLAAADTIMQGEPQLHFRNRYLRKDGRVVDIQWSARWSGQDQARIAVGRDVTELRHAEAVQSALLAISEAAHATGDLPALFARIHQTIGTLLPARNCFVALHDAGRGLVEFPYFVDEFDAAPAPLPLEAPTLSNQVIRSGDALLLAPGRPGDQSSPLQPVVGRDALDWLGVPLRTDAGVIGALVVQSYNSGVRYTERDKQLLEFVSAQIAAAIERKRSQARLEHLVGHDPLTDLPNRSRFDERLERALAAAPRARQRLALLYLDLDGFKQVNDRHGHDLGDQLLHAVGQRIRQCVRRTDTVARMGGDEFVVLLGGVDDAADAYAIAESIRAALARPFSLEGAHVQVTASIGAALHPEHGVEKKSLLRSADSAMYAAKRQGGNRLVARGQESVARH
ncbi:MAG TPA: diguanylate cyclase [Luteimonas sp.]|nr:diguanylate cyclase [Luteimonas sp.]